MIFEGQNTAAFGLYQGDPTQVLFTNQTKILNCVYNLLLDAN